MAGCPMEPAADGEVIASVINVTPFEIEAVLTGVLGDLADTTLVVVAPSSSVDVAFSCLDELLIGDPFMPDAPGVTLDLPQGAIGLDAFAVLSPESFLCGDIVEIIVSGSDPDDFTIDVFALTPP